MPERKEASMDSFCKELRKEKIRKRSNGRRTGGTPKGTKAGKKQYKGNMDKWIRLRGTKIGHRPKGQKRIPEGSLNLLHGGGPKEVGISKKGQALFLKMKKKAKKS